MTQFRRMNGCGEQTRAGSPPRPPAYVYRFLGRDLDVELPALLRLDPDEPELKPLVYAFPYPESYF